MRTCTEATPDQPRVRGRGLGAVCVGTRERERTSRWEDNEATRIVEQQRSLGPWFGSTPPTALKLVKKRKQGLSAMPNRVEHVEGTPKRRRRSGAARPAAEKVETLAEVHGLPTRQEVCVECLPVGGRRKHA